MKNKILIVVDVQNDFVTGSMGSKTAQDIIPGIVKKINDFDGVVIYTRDTHQKDYLNTNEGKKLPITHCIEETQGWELIPELVELSPNYIVNKPTFGYTYWKKYLTLILGDFKDEELEVSICGLVTDICVVSNALMLKALYPEAKINVIESCCAGTTKENHDSAISVMTMCQINII